jgi:hypothetical protein
VVDERQGKDVSSAKSQLRRRFHLVSRLSEGPGSFRFRTMPAFTQFSSSRLIRGQHLDGLDGTCFESVISESKTESND